MVQQSLCKTQRFETWIIWWWRFTVQSVTSVCWCLTQRYQSPRSLVRNKTDTTVMLRCKPNDDTNKMFANPWPLSNILSSNPLHVVKVSGTRSLISSVIFGLKSFGMQMRWKLLKRSDSHGSKRHGKHFLLNQTKCYFGLKHKEGLYLLWNTTLKRSMSLILQRGWGPTNRKKNYSSQHILGSYIYTGTGLCVVLFFIRPGSNCIWTPTTMIKT